MSVLTHRVPTQEHRRPLLHGRAKRPVSSIAAGLAVVAIASLLLSTALAPAAEARSCRGGKTHVHTLPDKWEYIKWDIASYSIKGRWCSVRGRIRWASATINQYAHRGTIVPVSKSSGISRSRRSVTFRGVWHINWPGMDLRWFKAPGVDQDVCLRLGAWASGRTAQQGCP